MIKPQPLKKGDKVSIISLSTGMLGESYCSHQLEIGVRRLKELGLEVTFTENALKGVEFIMTHPEARAADLKAAFLDSSIRGIICAIGGIDTFRTFPYLMEDEEFIKAVHDDPKFFLGFSDTTNNHFMFHRLGLQTYYGQAFLCDIAELADDMLPYSKAQFLSCFEPYSGRKITPADIWYEDRTDFSAAALGTEAASHKEAHGYELLQGSPQFGGELLGGCIESMGEMLLADRVYIPELAEEFKIQGEITRRYNIFPSAEEWRGKVLFVETSEERPSPQRLKQLLEALKEQGVFDNINGIIIGKPQNEQYYEEYKEVWSEVVDDPKLPILYNVNFGHAAPRAILPYGAKAQVDAEKQEILLL